MQDGLGREGQMSSHYRVSPGKGWGMGRRRREREAKVGERKEKG